MNYREALALAQKEENQIPWKSAQLFALENQLKFLQLNFIVNNPSTDDIDMIGSFDEQITILKRNKRNYNLRGIKELGKKFNLSVDENELILLSLKVFCERKRIELIS